MTTTNPEDIIAVTDVLLTERAARDLGRWEEMRGTFLDDSRVRVSWFHGTGARFVDASKDIYDAGGRAFHEIGAVRVEIQGAKALAQAGATVHLRGSLHGVEVDLTSYGRLYWRLRRTGAEWRIATLEMLYIKDTLAAADPTHTVTPDMVSAAARHRPSYRYLTLMLHAGGHQIDQDLPGSDRPDLTDRFLADHLVWLVDRR